MAENEVRNRARNVDEMQAENVVAPPVRSWWRYITNRWTLLAMIWVAVALYCGVQGYLNIGVDADKQTIYTSLGSAMMATFFVVCALLYFSNKNEQLLAENPYRHVGYQVKADQGLQTQELFPTE